MNSLKNFLVVAFTLLIVSSYAQCNEYFPIKANQSWTYENYNRKDKLQGSQKQKVTEYESTSTGFKAVMQVDAFDKKGRELTSGELEIICENGILHFDMRRFISEEQLKAMESYELEIEAENLEYPSDLKKGKALEDGSITVTAKNSPIPIKITVNIIDRMAQGIESIETPAGTFEAMKISGKSVIENQMGVNMTFEFEQNEWIAKDVGMVKSESFRKGKLESYTLLVDRGD